jgi:MFS family permease
MTSNLRRALDEGPMSRFQWSAIAICIALVMLDGFDVLVMAFTAASVSAEWKLTGAQLGMLFSAGLFGMAAGSLFLAPLADRFGRQAIILLCLTVIAAGMGLSALAHSGFQMAAARAFTGLGIGGMLASVGVITAEYASNKWRSTAVAFQATGYPIGATIGGSIAAVLLEVHGWRSVFVFGAVVTAAMIPLVVWRLPESVDFRWSCGACRNRWISLSPGARRAPWSGSTHCCAGCSNPNCPSCRRAPESRSSAPPIRSPDCSRAAWAGRRCCCGPHSSC